MAQEVVRRRGECILEDIRKHVMGHVNLKKKIVINTE
jgi:hypothetical protein